MGPLEKAMTTWGIRPAAGLADPAGRSHLRASRAPPSIFQKGHGVTALLSEASGERNQEATCSSICAGSANACTRSSDDKLLGILSDSSSRMETGSSNARAAR